ncbi:class I SAM-dependent methyltransferase [Brevibacillus laterosporus]|uniref:class I SAM-dependent methyltransferase n=1 Tax=Brevibacillus laterosporus TaxID=1465 RepID=UPI000CE4198B|nr:class I SAM-dependent methyltransferase [Brevibacillus laterosporus]MED1666779.1 methyltransferase domain-containing protein [Brevibacillus laterosporus]MED1670677.1 methyltransferase domain-containing protein [Brevibacillus laterosporus]MED1720369.1 methyltransferase domain-containing protein [Brevibacillus laterosporus]PPA83143.1 SAM-dependent methyltransferase [Brevibacillus laterosporus]
MKEWNTFVSQQWNQMAGDWHERSKGMWEQGSRKTILPLFTELLPAHTGPILDAGCGDGYASFKLASVGYNVTGLDISSEMIAYATQQTRRLSDSTSLQFMEGDISATPYSDRTFAGILSVNAMEFTSSPLLVLQEFQRILQPNGLLLLGVLGPTAGPRAHSYPRLYGKSTIQNTIMPWEAKQLAQENGFCLQKESHVFKDDFPPDLADSLSMELREAVSFVTLLALRKHSHH